MHYFYNMLFLKLGLDLEFHLGDNPNTPLQCGPSLICCFQCRRCRAIVCHDDDVLSFLRVFYDVMEQKASPPKVHVMEQEVKKYPISLEYGKKKIKNCIWFGLQEGKEGK